MDRRANLRNATLAAVVPLPSLIFYSCFLQQDCFVEAYSAWRWIRNWGYSHPFQLLNLIFFLNVNVLFWIISLVQQNTWLIDPYWTLLPVLIGHYYATHPSADADPFRSKAVLGLVWIWSIRLTHSYFRRENWNWGAREDWRFADLRRAFGKHWWWISFFAVYVSQQIFLMGICLPLYDVHKSKRPWNSLDAFAATVCVAGILIAYVADTQLHRFVTRKRVMGGASRAAILDDGLWLYSRHPNYVGEQIWWWGLGLFSCNTGHPLSLVGALVNTLCLAHVTMLVEKRMVADETREAAYRMYQKRTCIWIPLNPFNTAAT